MSQTFQDYISNPYQAYTTLIQNYDKAVMEPLSKFLSESRTDSERKYWRKKIDESLDERLRMSEIRNTFRNPNQSSEEVSPA